MITIHIISCGWNCESYIARCMESVARQVCDGFAINHVVIVDGWGYREPIPGLPKPVGGNIPITWRVTKVGAAANIVDGIGMANPDPEDIIALVDLDDQLAGDPGILKFLYEVYAESDILLTYGSYVLESTAESYGKFNGEYKRGGFRKQPWMASHLKTFKAKLWNKFDYRLLQDKTTWQFYQAGSDVALMLPLMEMAGYDRIKHIHRPMYIYNDKNPMSDHIQNKAMQKRVEKTVRSMRPLRPINV